MRWTTRRFQETAMTVLSKSLAARVEDWSDERRIGNRLIVTLNWGWRFEDLGEHVRGYDTVREAKQGIRAAIPCACQECRDALQPKKHG
jgi:hypothetical protein